MGPITDIVRRARKPRRTQHAIPGHARARGVRLPAPEVVRCGGDGGARPSVELRLLKPRGLHLIRERLSAPDDAITSLTNRSSKFTPTSMSAALGRVATPVELIPSASGPSPLPALRMPTRAISARLEASTAVQPLPLPQTWATSLHIGVTKLMGKAKEKIRKK